MTEFVYILIIITIMWAMIRGMKDPKEEV